jgi:protein CpxP
MMFKTIKPATFGLAVATLLGAAALAAPLSPAWAATPAKSAAAEAPEARVEAHIANLKAKLKITDAQSAQWDGVAAVMRENAKEAQSRVATRNATGAEATAVDDLRNYEAMAEGHAEGLKRMVTAFEALYATMSDEQKKNADMVFAEHEGRGKHKPTATKKG